MRTIILALVLAGCGPLRTEGQQEVSGRVDVVHTIRIELPAVLLDECSSLPTEIEQQECIDAYYQDILNLIRNYNEEQGLAQ